MKRVVRLTLLAALTMGPIALVAAWLMFQHRPDWYQPAVLDETAIHRARAEATALADSVSDRMVQGRPFDVVLIDRRVNEWLTALPHSWPEIQRAMPREIRDWAVRFADGQVRIGAHYERAGWQAIVSVGFRLRVSGDGASVEITLTEAQGGSLPVPRGMIERLIGPLLERAQAARSGSGDSAEALLLGLGNIGSIDELFGGVKVVNRFIWGNGDRPFRIDAITIDGGKLRLRMEPL